MRVNIFIHCNYLFSFFCKFYFALLIQLLSAIISKCNTSTKKKCNMNSHNCVEHYCNRVMPIVRERGIFMLLIRVLNQFCNPIEGSIQKLHRLKAAETLSLLVETEDFNTHRCKDEPTLIKFCKIFVEQFIYNDSIVYYRRY